MKNPVPPSRIAAIRDMAADESLAVETRLALLDLLAEIQSQSDLLAHARADLHVAGVDSVDCCPGGFDPSAVRRRLRTDIAENLYRMWLCAITGARLTESELDAIQPVAHADIVRHVHVTLAAARRAKTVLGLVA